MIKKLSLIAIASGLALALAGHARAASYEYHFTANPSADSSGPIDPALNVDYTFGFNSDALPNYSLTELSNANNWASGAIWLKMSHQGKTVNLADAIDPTAIGLQLPSEALPGSGGLYSSGWIETDSDINEFLDVDLHPWSSFVANNSLPFDPFVYGQLDVYDDQKDFQDAFALWSVGDTSSLSAHVATVPEPASTALLLAGLIAGGFARTRRRNH